MTITTEKRQSPPKKIMEWFDIRNRDAGMWAFALNRVTGLGLTFYLFLHLIVLSTLARGPQAYDDFIAIVKSPVFVFGEWLVVAAGLYHGLNGLRIALTSFGVVVPYQKQIFYAILAISIIGSIVFGIYMFSA